jgi:hypothetical protein
MTLIALLKMLNASFVWMLFLVMLSMISFAKGQAVSCVPSMLLGFYDQAADDRTRSLG